MFNTRFWTIVAIVLAAAATRLVPHPPNMTAIGARGPVWRRLSQPPLAGDPGAAGCHVCQRRRALADSLFWRRLELGPRELRLLRADRRLGPAASRPRGRGPRDRGCHGRQRAVLPGFQLLRLVGQPEPIRRTPAASCCATWRGCRSLRTCWSATCSIAACCSAAWKLCSTPGRICEKESWSPRQQSDERGRPGLLVPGAAARIRAWRWTARCAAAPGRYAC